MCDCMELVDKDLAQHGVQLNSNILSEPRRAILQTIPLTPKPGEKRRRRRPPVVLATYCPFCGTKYPPFEDPFTEKSDAA
jgi:hypothetical protein